MPWPIKLPALRRPRSRRLTEAYQISGTILLLTNRDRPGIVGHLGTLLGRHQVNIASMSLSRDTLGGDAFTVLNLDSEPPAAVLAELEADPDICNVKVVKL